VRGRKLPSFQPPVYNINIHTHKKHQTKVKFEKNVLQETCQEQTLILTGAIKWKKKGAGHKISNNWFQTTFIKYRNSHVTGPLLEQFGRKSKQPASIKLLIYFKNPSSKLPLFGLKIHAKAAYYMYMRVHLQGCFLLRM
jgi:hypothetical protein